MGRRATRDEIGASARDLVLRGRLHGATVVVDDHQYSRELSGTICERSGARVDDGHSFVRRVRERVAQMVSGCPGGCNGSLAGASRSGDVGGGSMSGSRVTSGAFGASGGNTGVEGGMGGMIVMTTDHSKYAASSSCA